MLILPVLAEVHTWMSFRCFLSDEYTMSTALVIVTLSKGSIFTYTSLHTLESSVVAREVLINLMIKDPKPISLINMQVD